MNLISTPAGRNWCTAALDPFHDYTQTVSGMPDDLTTPSFVRMHVQTLSVSSSAVGDTINIVFNGLSHSLQDVCSVLNPGAIFTTLAGEISQMQPVNIIRGTNGNMPSIGNCCPNNVALCQRLGGFSVIPDTTIPARVIALGLEVHDTTAPLNRQGTIAVMHCPGPWSETSVAHSDSTGGAGTVITATSFPPMVTALKSVMASSPTMIEWEAAKGAYVVARLIRRDLCRPIEQTYASSSTIKLPHSAVVREQNNGASVGYLQPVATTKTPVLGWVWSEGPMWPTGFQPFVVHLSELSASSSFRVTLRTYVEYFPELSNGIQLQNALNSPPYDPTAFVEYSRAIMALPSAVPVGMNAKGDWWKMVQNAFRIGAKVAGEALPVVLSAAGQPALAGAVTVLGQTLKSSVRPTNQKKKKSQTGSKGSNRKRS